MIQRLKSTINAAVEKLYTDDYNLIIRGGMEPACVARIFCYLYNLIKEDDALRGFDPDSEYDRNGNKKKEIRDPQTGDRLNTRPDILIHGRGHNNYNRLVIEAKGWWNGAYKNDYKKLRGFTDQNGEYKYTLGIFLKLNKKGVRYDFFECGEKVDTQKIVFRR